jgi:hypothetical protein
LVRRNMTFKYSSDASALTFVPRLGQKVRGRMVCRNLLFVSLPFASFL